jgi:ADP-ribosylglycohydrolase
VGGAYEASISTHGGSLAIAGAAANAAAVSAAIDGASGPEVLEFAATAAASAEARWPRGGSEPPLADAIRAVQRALASLPTLGASEVAGWCFPNQRCSEPDPAAA